MRPGLQPRLTFDPTRTSPRRTYNRRASARGDPARAGRQQPGRDRDAFDRAGFTAVDVHMSDLIAGRLWLEDFAGFVACGGFSYGDVLGAGRGWATSILERPDLRDAFRVLRAQRHVFAGRCNGCQMMAQLKDRSSRRGTLAAFLRNRGEQYEARLALLEVFESPSLFLRGMAGSRIPVAVAHGEGARRSNATGESGVGSRAALRRRRRRPADDLSGQSQRIARRDRRLTTTDGRATILMPHPGTHPAHGQLQLGAARVGGRWAVAAHVPQRAGVGS